MSEPAVHLFLPQIRLRPEQLVERACMAEAAGFHGMAFVDHLVTPMAEDQPLSEAFATATWVAAHTRRLVIGHLVLCDSLRPPALLAKQAVSLDHLSQGRFELGLGWGSFAEELDAAGLGATPAARVRRLAESLDVIKALWSGEPVDYAGEFHEIRGLRQRPTPLTRIPIVIGGVGERTLRLVAAHADWWNVPLYGLEQLGSLRPKAGAARVSAQLLVAFVGAEQRADDVAAAAHRNFGGGPFVPLVADAKQLIEHFRVLAGNGVERFYVWFADSAKPSTLQEFGERVIGGLCV
jgi:alkanesulfonate monooxygenase SsuD/methylene tetrahydromethanopterin reductase-like flavin-dependent oxidoreductase (luciferase family)